MLRRTRESALLLVVVALCTPLAVADLVSNGPTLDQGFRLLYQLDFRDAHQVFASWEQQHPENPLGPVSDAAGLLFSEFNRLGVLESQFYESDKAFDERKQLAPDPSVREQLNAALAQAESEAKSRLKQDPNDRDALFSLTLASGLRSDYAALIEKHNIAALRFTKDASVWAKQLLAVDPKYYDAHLATGVSQYIIGSMTAPVRWLIRLGGIAANKQAGIEELQLTAEHGHYLAPFARILLAIAYVRERDKTHARQLLVSLSNDFPQNPLFAREIGRLDAQR
jgi:hypothetical protein